MKARHFLNQLSHEQIVAAIQQAEMTTSGEIRVFITRKPIEDPVPAAQNHFVALGMEKTRDRNGVLIFVAPKAHKFAVIGDAGVHAKCGEGFWTELAREMSGHFRKSDFTAGIVHGVRKAGELLAQHFPRRPDDTNELPDQVESD
ncbi:MAG TPA: TPM domain-containing protein [Verrucomicrobiae bacterium]|nr:TPM domain-containing protein [Verrucomicrobiae bacterium]